MFSDIVDNLFLYYFCTRLMFIISIFLLSQLNSFINIVFSNVFETFSYFFDFTLPVQADVLNFKFYILLNFPHITCIHSSLSVLCFSFLLWRNWLGRMVRIKWRIMAIIATIRDFWRPSARWTTLTWPCWRSAWIEATLCRCGSSTSRTLSYTA